MAESFTNSLNNIFQQ